MFRALLAHPQVALHERRFGDLCAVVGVGWSRDVRCNEGLQTVR
jgi:hypothetical protein